MSKVCLDFGHGGRDPGASGNGLREKDLTLSIGKKVGKMLEDHRVEVVYPRTADGTVSLAGRTHISNINKVDAFVSIHINAATNTSGNGVETFSYPGSPEGAELSKLIQDELVKSKIFRRNRGTKVARFYVLKNTIAPAALTELGFITNVDDAQVLRTRQDDIAKAVAKGILKYLGIKYVSEKPTPAPVQKETNKGDKEMTAEDLDKHWAKDNIDKVIKSGVMTRFEDGTFRPDNAVSRAEMATIIARIIDKYDLKVKDSGK